MVPQPPYSPDLSPCEFLLFPQLKNHLKGRHFGTLDNIQKIVTDKLNGIPAEAFQHCYEQWKQRLRRCVAGQGNYRVCPKSHEIYFVAALLLVAACSNRLGEVGGDPYLHSAPTVSLLRESEESG